MKMMGTCNHLVVGSNPTPGALHRTVQGGALVEVRVFVLIRTVTQLKEPPLSIVTTEAVFMFYTYVLRSLKDGKMYTGFTQDLRNRLKEHEEGKSPATEPRRPLELIFYEAYRNKYDALRREKYFKSSKGKATIQSMLRDFFGSLEKKESPPEPPGA